MQIILAILIILGAFVLTELSAWFTHKFIMHGFMWHFHADHHKKDHKSRFERNDIFFLIYAIPSWLCIMLGMMHGYAWYTWAGFGILLYGLAYFVVHDGIIHQRFKFFTRSNNLYILALRRAHKMHHKHIGKFDGESFGMLLIHPRYFQEAKKLKAAQKGQQ